MLGPLHSPGCCDLRPVHDRVDDSEQDNVSAGDHAREANPARVRVQAEQVDEVPGANEHRQRNSSRKFPDIPGVSDPGSIR